MRDVQTLLSFPINMIQTIIVVLVALRVITNASTFRLLKVIFHPLYSMNKFVTNKSKLPQDGAQVFP